MHFHILAVLATTTLLVTPSLALPHKLNIARTPDCPDTPPDNRQYATPGVTPEQLTLIYPQTASCNGADFPDECRDASQAADPINKSFDKYGLNTTGERAAAVALMLYESGGFRYNRNHFPGKFSSPTSPLHYYRLCIDTNFVSQVVPAKAPATCR